MKLIDKTAVMAEIENLLDKGKYHEEYDCAYRDGNNGALYALKGKLDTLEVKEVDLEKEYKDFVGEDPVYNKLVNGIVGKAIAKHFFELGLKAQHDNWKVENLWKPADGDDLPEIDREVVVLIKYNAQRNIHDEEYPTYRVGFGHRPNPNGWDGKNIDTNEVTHYTPKLYDKGGWNAPNIVYWLDARLPYEENKIDKEIEP